MEGSSCDRLAVERTVPVTGWPWGVEGPRCVGCRWGLTRVWGLLCACGVGRRSMGREGERCVLNLQVSCETPGTECGSQFMTNDGM
jgi:hypothetical protein